MAESCWWVWSGLEWLEHPSFPHNCPQGQVCQYPAADGTYVGEEKETKCVDGPD